MYALIVWSMFAQLPIQDRILNENGHCAWSALEMLGRNCKEKRLYGLMKDKKTAGFGTNIIELDQELTNRKIKHTTNYPGDKNWDFIMKSMEKGGCVVGVSDWPVPKASHAIFVFKIKDGWMYFHDPNDTQHFYYTWALWLWEHWEGYGVSLETE